MSLLLSLMCASWRNIMVYLFAKSLRRLREDVDSPCLSSSPLLRLSVFAYLQGLMTLIKVNCR